MLLLVTAAFGASAAIGQTAGPSKEKVLRVVENGLRTCSGVQKVQREGSLFRLYDGSFMREFDLDDMRSLASGAGLSLQCEATGCVTSSLPSVKNDGAWKEMGAQNFVVLQCYGAATQIHEAVEYYRTNF